VVDGCFEVAEIEFGLVGDWFEVAKGFWVILLLAMGYFSMTNLKISKNIPANPKNVTIYLGQPQKCQISISTHPNPKIPTKIHVLLFLKHPTEAKIHENPRRQALGLRNVFRELPDPLHVQQKPSAKTRNSHKNQRNRHEQRLDEHLFFARPTISRDEMKLRQRMNARKRRLFARLIGQQLKELCECGLLRECRA
jgi:hypothetical protein